MKKFISIILLVLFIISGCSSDNMSGETEARAVGTAFMDCFIKLDIDGALKYADQSDESAIESLKEMDIRKEFDSALSELGTDVSSYSDIVSSLYNIVLERIKSLMKYEITDVSGNGTKYIYSMNVTVVDEEKTEEIGTEVSEKLISSLGEDVMISVAKELYNEGKITVESTQEEIMKAMFEKITPELEKTINEINIETKIIPVKLTVTGKSGEWVVDLSESSF